MAMMSDALVHIDRSQSSVAVVSLQRAEKRNALNIAILEELTRSLEGLEQDPTCRVVIIRGEGSVFCAGLDLVEANDPNVAEKSADGIRRVVTLIRESSLIVIAAAVGGAYAGGAGLLAACDLAVVAEDLRLGFPEVRRGLVAAIVWGVLVGKLRDGDLRELLLVAEPIGALRAQQMGLVQWIVPNERVLAHAREMAQHILAGGPEAVRESKRLLNRDPRSVDFRSLQSLHERIRHGAEAREGFAAFRDRREPNWSQNS